jgi:putative transposase
LRTAWDRCFKKTSAPPKFKKKGKHDSFTLDGTIKIKGQNKIQVPIIGTVRTFEDLPQVPVKNVTISRQADYWFISFKVEIETKLNNVADNPVGVDLGQQGSTDRRRLTSSK